jgi:O-antigen/teichoic acid export membrane protein
MVHTIRSMFTINLTLGTIVAALVLSGAPYASSRLAISSTTSSHECWVALSIAGVLVLARAVESVAVSTQRAFEAYRMPTLIAVATRVFTLTSAILLAILGTHAIGLLLGTGVFLVVGSLLQVRQLQRIFEGVAFWPALHAKEIRYLLGAGVFLWMQAIGGIVFGYLDRILLGLSMGARAVTPYVLCIQFAQPIFGITASGLHFLFPHLATRIHSMPASWLRRAIFKAFALNVFTVATISCGLLLFGARFLRMWAGEALAGKTHGVFQPIILGSALTGLSITGVYALQAMGLFRTVSLILLSSRIAMSLLMLLLLRHSGLNGLLAVRILYGAATLLVYVPLVFRLRRGHASNAAVVQAMQTGEMAGGSQA